MERKLMNLKNKKFLLTGGTGYIGSITAKEILKNGGKLIFTTTTYKKLKNFKSSLRPRLRSNCEGYIVDLNNENEIENLINKIKKKYKYLNGIVNNAYGGSTGSIQNIKKIDFLRATNLNLYAPFKIIKDLKHLLEKGFNKSKTSSSIVNIGSMYGSVSPDGKIYKASKDQNPVHYGSTKAGLIQMTKYLACNLNGKKIRVNCISPGPIPNKKVSKNFIKKLIKKTPAQRIGKPIEIAFPVVFLLSDASSYINGANIPVDGGWTSW